MDNTQRQVEELEKLFSWMADDPEAIAWYLIPFLELRKMAWLLDIGSKCAEIVFAWGNFQIVKDKNRDKELTQMFPTAKALVKNKDGSPRHPLYVPSNITLINFLNP